jgi:hypothetical protein
VEIEGVEVGRLSESGFVEYGNTPPVEFQKTLVAQLLDYAVHVDHTGSDGISEKCLSRRKAEAEAVGPPNGLQPGVQFQYEVRYAARCIALTDITDPFAEDGRVRKGVSPKSLRDVGTMLYQLPQWSVRYETQHGIAERADVVIHDVKKKALQIGDVTRLVECHDLALPDADDLRS